MTATAEQHLQRLEDISSQQEEARSQERLRELDTHIRRRRNLLEQRAEEIEHDAAELARCEKAKSVLRNWPSDKREGEYYEAYTAAIGAANSKPQLTTNSVATELIDGCRDIELQQQREVISSELRPVTDELAKAKARHRENQIRLQHLQRDLADAWVIREQFGDEGKRWRKTKSPEGWEIVEVIDDDDPLIFQEHIDHINSKLIRPQRQIDQIKAEGDRVPELTKERDELQQRLNDVEAAMIQSEI